MLLLDSKPFSLALVRARAREPNHLACGVEAGSASFLEGLLETCSAFHAFELEHVPGQDLASGSPKCVHNKDRKLSGPLLDWACWSALPLVSRMSKVRCWPGSKLFTGAVLVEC